MCCRARCGEGSIDIEGGLESAIGLVFEVVTHTTQAAHLIARQGIGESREVLGAEHVGIECLGILGIELLVGEVDEDDQTMEIVEVKIGKIHIALGAAHVGLCHCRLVDKMFTERREQTQLIGIAVSLVMGQDSGRNQSHAVKLGIFIGTGLVKQYCIAVGCSVKVIKLVTNKLNGDQGAVGLRHLYHAAMGRNGKRLKAHDC